MQLITLGKSPLKVSRLCLGTMMFGDQTPLEDARAIVADAHEKGCNFIDTADVYTRGKSEEMVGQILKGQRQSWVLASKVGNPMSDQPNQQGYSRSWMLRACEDSLHRLDTDHVDIYYLHRDYNGMNLEEPLRVIEALLRDGKIRYWGVSNFRGWRIAEMVNMARQMNMPGPVVCQPYYNLLNRLPEVEILEACGHYGLGVVPYSPIARGVLTGKYAPGQTPQEGSRVARGDKRILETEFREESLQVAQVGDRRPAHLGPVARLRRGAASADHRRRRSLGQQPGGPRASLYTGLQRSFISYERALKRLWALTRWCHCLWRFRSARLPGSHMTGVFVAVQGMPVRMGA